MPYLASKRVQEAAESSQLPHGSGLANEQQPQRAQSARDSPATDVTQSC